MGVKLQLERYSDFSLFSSLHINIVCLLFILQAFPWGVFTHGRQAAADPGTLLVCWTFMYWFRLRILPCKAGSAAPADVGGCFPWFYWLHIRALCEFIWGKCRLVLLLLCSTAAKFRSLEAACIFELMRGLFPRNKGVLELLPGC